MWTSTLTSFLFLGQAYAGLLGDLSLIPRDDSIDAKMRRYVDTIVEPVKRQSTTPALNVTAWNEQTIAACTSTLQALNGVASNPSGIAACYNLPFWDNTTGVFHADLRLFMISPPTGSFANISAQDVQVDLSYSRGSVSSVPNSELRRRDEALSFILTRREMEKRQAPVPVLTQSYAFFGQMNTSILGSDLATLEQALVPVVTLSGVDAQGQTVSTSLSTTEASFVNGVFAQEKTVTQVNVAAAPMQTLVVAPGQTFVVPGLHILITPIGGIITGTWALLLMSTIAYGTVGRMQFKDHYRRRVARATKVVTI